MRVLTVIYFEVRPYYYNYHIEVGIYQRDCQKLPTHIVVVSIHPHRII